MTDGDDVIPQRRQGTVYPHMHFKAQLGDGGVVMSSTSDLAVILLAQPMEGVAPVFQLTESEVEIDDELVAVGYGYIDLQRQKAGKRFFGRNTVTQKARSNLTDKNDKDISFLFEMNGVQALEGDSGGPCFREDGQERHLVGIISQGDGTVSRFTSIFPHLLWLKDHLARAERLAKQL